jgi:hypothetical protein
MVRFIKSQGIRWLGHVERMEGNGMPKRILKGRLYSKRRKERSGMDREDEDQRAVETGGTCRGGQGSPKAVALSGR